MKDEERVLAEFRATAAGMGLTPEEAEDAIARARQVAADSGVPLERVLFEESAEQSVHMGREG